MSFGDMAMAMKKQLAGERSTCDVCNSLCMIGPYQEDWLYPRNLLVRKRSRCRCFPRSVLAMVAETWERTLVVERILPAYQL